MKSKWKIGFHTAGAGGNPTGIGDYVRKLGAAGIPATVACTDGTVGLIDAQVNSRDTNTRHNIMWRPSTRGQNDGFDYDVPNMQIAPFDSFDECWAKYLSVMPPELNKELVTICVGNEIRTENAPDESIYNDMTPMEFWGLFGLRAYNTAKRDGYTIGLYAFAAGTPAENGWDNQHMVELLQLIAIDPGPIVIVLHEYSYENYLLAGDTTPWKIGRFAFLKEVCEKHGIDFSKIPILIKEFGWKHTWVPAPDVAIPQLREVAEMYGRYPNILGVATWYLGPGFGNIDDMTQSLITPVTEATLNETFHYPDPPIEPPDPEPADPEPPDPPVGHTHPEIENRLRTVESELGSAIQRISDLEDLFGRMDLVEGDLTDLDKRVTVLEGGEIPTPEKIYVIDVSLHQGTNVDYKQVKASGGEMVVIRYGSGRTPKDPNFDYNYYESIKNGLQVATYWYLYQDVSIEKQVTQFLDGCKSYPELKFAVLDVENAGLRPDHVKKFIDLFEAQSPFKEKIMIYTAAWFWNPSNGYVNVDWAAQHDLFVAHYVSNNEYAEPNENFKPLIPSPWREWRMWQYSSLAGTAMGQRFPNLDISYWDTGVDLDTYGGRKDPSNQVVDVSQFMFGNLKPGTKGPLYELQTKFYDSGNNEYDIPGPQQRHQTQFDSDGMFYLSKDKEWEQLWIADYEGVPWIWRGWDVSQSETEMYAQRDPSSGDLGAPWCPVNMVVNRYYRRNPLIVHYMKSSCRESSRGVVPSYIVCRGVVKKTLPDGTTMDAVELEWSVVEGGDALEVYYFSGNSKVSGLAGFWTPGQRMAEISELHEPGQRPDNERWELPANCS